MSSDMLGLLAAIVLVFASAFAGLWLIERRARRRVQQEKRTGRLPSRRSPIRPVPPNPVLIATALVLVAFAPVVLWAGSTALYRLIAPPEAWEDLRNPTFRQSLRTTLTWWLILAGLAFLGWVLTCLVLRVFDWLEKRFEDLAVSRAADLVKAGQVDEAIAILRQTIDADGPSSKRLNVLAACLMDRERWAEALQVSLEIEDRSPLVQDNRRRKFLAICHLGRPEVAAAQFFKGSAGQGAGGRIVDICSYCEMLIELGLIDRAWDQLRSAEVLFGRGTIPEADRPRFRKEIDACRTRLAEHFADEKPSPLDEL